ncbi:hypothetical protein [Sphingobium yanoikuyae]|nr:hypothetical protein [Sphingobium yanoikuyae]
MMDDLGNVRRWLSRFGMDVDSNPMQRVDPLAQFLSDFTVRGDCYQVATPDLYQRFVLWCGYSGQAVWSMRGFDRAMSAAGYKKRFAGGAVWLGLRLDGDGEGQPVARALVTSARAQDKPSAKWSAYAGIASCKIMSASTRSNTASAKPAWRASSSFKIAVMKAKAAVASVVVSLMQVSFRVSRGGRTITEGGASDSPVLNSRRRAPGGDR